MPKKRKKKKKKRLGPARRRNPFALIAKMRSSAGSHGHPAKEESKRACRGRVNIDDHVEEDE